MKNKLFVIFDILALAVLNIILWTSLYIQFVHSELPCPLCLFQRMGIIGIGLGYVLNLYFGTKSQHYAIGAISGILTATVAIVQILMHIVPDTGTYGSPFLGLHLYIWAFLLSSTFILANLIMILLLNESKLKRIVYKKTALIVVVPLLLSMIINSFSAFAECGIYQCPADPKSYWISKIFTPKISKKHKKRAYHKASE